MPEPQVSFNRDVDVQAFLYANGELNGVEAVYFERRLAEEQAAREALSQAVCLCERLGSSARGPDPMYRERVRRRLRPEPGLDRFRGQIRVERGHPILWCVLGAAAVLLFFAFERIDERRTVQTLDLKTEQLKQELSQVEEELLKTRAQNEKKAVQRSQGFPDKADRQKR